ncbi:MAG TPA: ABC transporter permease [Vicinamibacterales bacterium]|jgi:ABC-type transport system involved in multi-copper enzyme maturation permease subunit|nr:ABC transporter permease [Vicinamibacterales bacterium]
MSADSTPRRPLSFLTATLRIFDIAVGQLLWSRRTVFMALAAGGPVVLALVLRALDASGVSALRVNGARVGGPVMFGGMIWLLYLRFVVPVLGAFYGTALVSDEVDDRTITYLFTRPIARGSIVVGKYLAYLACTVLVVLPSVMAAYVLLTPIGGGSIAETFPLLLADLGLLALGLAVYGAVFALIGASVPRPLVVSLILVFGWEQLALVVPGYLRQFTVAYYLQSLVPHAMPHDETMTAIQSLFSEPPSAPSSIFSLCLILVVALGFAAHALQTREYVLEQ